MDYKKQMMEDRRKLMVEMREDPEQGFRCLDWEMDGAIAGGGGPDGDDPEETEPEGDGCTVWEYKLHRENIIDGPSPSSSIKFASKEDILDFLDAKKNSTGNPFTGNKPAIMFCPDEATDAETFYYYTQAAHKFTYTFGKYVKEVEVKLWRTGMQYTIICFVTALLQKLPNLKALHLNLRPGPGEMQLPTAQSFIGLMKVKLGPLASKLEYLNFRVYKSSDALLFHAVLEVYGPKLRKMSVTPFTWELLTVEQQKKFEDLEEFNLCWYSNQCMLVDEDAMYAPFPEGFAPKLEKLRLLYTDCSKVERPVEWLFYLLQKFPRLTLLNLTGFHLLSDDKVLVKDLPGNATLKTLKFQDHADMKYDFLKRLTGLQNLFIEGNRFETSYETEEDTFEAGEGEIKLRCFLYRKQLSKSNIWEKVPSLKKVVLERWAKSGRIPPEAEEYLKPE